MKYVLVLFGALGLAISCVQGIEPLIEVTQWVAWITDHWVELTHKFWALLASLIGLRMPTFVSDALSGVTYTIALFVGFRRLDVAPDGRIFRSVNWIENALSKSERIVAKNRFGKFAHGILEFSIFIPYFLIIILLLINSFTQGIIFYLISLLFSRIENIVPEKFLNKAYHLGFQKLAHSSARDVGDIIAMVYFVMPILVLGIVAGILVVNEIGHNGANIRNAYEWARCDAGIECESAKR